MEKACILYIQKENNDKANKKWGRGGTQNQTHTNKKKTQTNKQKKNQTNQTKHTADSLRERMLALYCPKEVVLMCGETMAISNRKYT